MPVEPAPSVSDSKDETIPRSEDSPADRNPFPGRCWIRLFERRTVTILRVIGVGHDGMSLQLIGPLRLITVAVMTITAITAIAAPVPAWR